MMKKSRFSEQQIAFVLRRRFRGSDVVETLERVVSEIGCPKTIRLRSGVHRTRPVRAAG